MTQLYLGVGHGITPKGAFDQGAQAPGRNEYELNWRVVAAAAIALERCGISFINEEAAGKGHDPDFVGSANKANDAHVQLAIEVHHNASKPPHPGFGCEMWVSSQTTEENRQLGRRIAALLHQELELNVRGQQGVSISDDLGFLTGTKMPAMIPEISFIDNDTDRKISGRADYATKAGEALAQAICEHFGRQFVPPTGVQPATTPGDRAPVVVLVTAAPAQHGRHRRHRRTRRRGQFPHRRRGGPGPHRQAAGLCAQEGTETPGQGSLIAEALAFRPLPDDRRGVASTLGGLAGPGRWAADPQYATKVAWVANQVSQTA